MSSVTISPRLIGRPVEVSTYRTVDGKAVRTKEATGRFHAFGIDYEMFDNTAQFTTAIVELTDGTLRNVPVRLIKFLDRE
jgi:hypothetical protein